jgi:hypothetical protein
MVGRPEAGTMTTPSAGPEQTAAPDPCAPFGAPAMADPGSAPAAADVPVTAARVAPAREPLLPERSPEDTDAAWGDYRERDDDRLYRDRPPHWDDF